MYIPKGETPRKTKEDKNMKRIDYLEQMREEEKKYSETHINMTFGQAYFAARRNENNLIDFSEAIWEQDIDQITENLAEFEIREFTISSTFSGLVTIIAEFDKRGWRVAGITEVNSSYSDFMTNEKKVIPAFRMQKA